MFLALIFFSLFTQPRMMGGLLEGLKSFVQNPWQASCMQLTCASAECLTAG